MFNPVEDLASSSEKFPGIYRAEVIDVDDPMTSGRVKVRVHPMMFSLDAAVLPWAAPAFDLFEGGKAGIGSYTVPSVGSHVFVFFEAGDVTQPVYFASAMAKTFGPSGKAPDKKIWKSRSGHLIEIDDTSGSETVRVTHKGGHLIEIDKDGKITVEGSGDLKVESTGGKVQVLASGDVEVEGSSIKLGKNAAQALVHVGHTCLFTGAPHVTGSCIAKSRN